MSTPSPNAVVLRFGAFRLEPDNERLWREDRPVALSLKAFRVLCELARRPEQLVTKQELLDTVWADVIVTDGVLKAAIREIRKALKDRPKNSRFIETVHRRGYRFIAVLEDEPAAPAAAPVPAGRAVAAPLVTMTGRESELGVLLAELRTAAAGARRIVCVTGRAGLGKTTLVRSFLARAAAEFGASTAHGQCVDQHGQGEAYMPVLDALGRLSRDPQSGIADVLLKHAPTWLAQMPSLLAPETRQLVESEILGATRQRSLREIAEALDVVSAERPLVLVLEDIHWSDFATIDLLRSLARRPDPAKLLILCTFRAEVVRSPGHPLAEAVTELLVQETCTEIALEPLSEAEIQAYLAERFESEPAEEVASLIHERTEGHPLFMARLVDDLVEKNALHDDGGKLILDSPLAEVRQRIPFGIRQMIESQVDRLAAEEKRLLEAGSVAGAIFLVETIAPSVDDEELELVEERCDALVRRGILQESVDDVLFRHTHGGHYAFSHSYYRDVLYERLPSVRKAKLHRRVGARLEELLGDRTPEFAAELAVHFELGRDFARAIRYLGLAAEMDARRHANREAASCLQRATRLVEHVAAEEQAGVRCDLLEQTGLLDRAIGNMEASRDSFAALVAATRSAGFVDRELQALLYLCSVQFWVERDQCHATVQAALARVGDATDELVRRHIRGYCGHWNLVLRGWNDADAEACRRAVEAAREADDRALLTLHVVRWAYSLMLSGDYAGARQAALEGMEHARAAGDGFDYLLAHFFLGWIELHAGEWRSLLETLSRGQELAKRNGHKLWSLLFTLEEAQMHAHAGSYDRARTLAQGVADEQETRRETGQLFYHSLIALGQALVGQGEIDEALRLFNEVRSRMREGDRPIDWFLRAPLHLGLFECRLARGELRRATRHAAATRLLGAKASEPTYEALGLEAAARLALAEKDVKAARAHVDAADAIVRARAAPLAEWRVLATAGAVAGRQRKKKLAGDRAEASRRALERLTDQLSA